MEISLLLLLFKKLTLKDFKVEPIKDSSIRADPFRKGN